MKSRKPIVRALVGRHLARNEEDAVALIEDDRVTVNGAPVLNSARQISDDDRLEVLEVQRFVSRGGLKLEGALAHFEAMGVPIEVAGSRVLDAGASTGGFVDCLLQRSAAEITAVDVGRGLLHPRIATDPRVLVCDGVHARDVAEMVASGRIRGGVDLLVADLSFISLTTVIESLAAAVRPGGTLLLLVKPQFEAEKIEVDRGGGVILDDSIRERCIAKVRAYLESIGADVVGEVESAITGPAGNREHWLRAVTPAPTTSASE